MYSPLFSVQWTPTFFKYILCIWAVKLFILSLWSYYCIVKLILFIYFLINWGKSQNISVVMFLLLIISLMCHRFDNWASLRYSWPAGVYIYMYVCMYIVASCNFPEKIGRKRRSGSTSSQTVFVYFLNLQSRTRVSGGVLTSPKTRKRTGVLLSLFPRAFSTFPISPSSLPDHPLSFRRAHLAPPLN